MNIGDILSGMSNVDIEGNIVDMNNFMLLMRDKTGQIFVRYWRKFVPREETRALCSKLKIGNNVKIANCDAFNWQGILQLKLARQGQVNLIS